MFTGGDSCCPVLRSSSNAMGGGGDSLTSSRCGVIGGLLGSGTVRGSTSSSNRRLLLFEKDEMYEIFFFWIRSRREGRLLRRGRLSIKVEDGRRAGPDVLSVWPKLGRHVRHMPFTANLLSDTRVWQFRQYADAKSLCVHSQLLCGL